jgi:hypothetical protein
MRCATQRWPLVCKLRALRSGTQTLQEECLRFTSLFLGELDNTSGKVAKRKSMHSTDNVGNSMLSSKRFNGHFA